MDYQHEHQSVHLIIYYFVWCPKRRKKVLVDEVATDLEQIIKDVAEEHAWKIIRLAIQPDHVHLFLRSTSQTTPYDIPRLIKGRSSRLLTQKYEQLQRLPSLWTRSYLCASAGNASQDIIDKYIQRQSKH